MNGYSKFKLLMILTVLLESALSLAAPFLLQLWSVQRQTVTPEHVAVLVSVMACAVIVQILVVCLREYFAQIFNKRSFQEQLNRYYTLSYDYINTQGPMSLLERMVLAVNSRYQFLTGDVIQIYANLVVIVVSLFLVLMQNPLIFSVLIAVIPIQYLGYHYLNRELVQRSQHLQEISSIAWRDVLSVTGQTDYIKQLGDPHCLQSVIDRPVEQVYAAQARVNAFAQSTSTLLAGISTVSRTLVMVLAILQGLATQDYMGILLVSVLVPMFFSSLQSVVEANLNRRDYDISQAFFDSWKQQAETDGTHVLDRVDTISIDLSTLQLGEKAVPVSIHQKFQRGDRIWIKGNSGAGKSTLVKLILRFWPSQGIAVNGVPLAEYSLQSLRSRVEYISQNVPIIKGTLRDNLFLGLPYSLALEKQMKQDPLLTSVFTTKTMDSEISEGASNLSGGEKQKIAMVRALYKEGVEVLILDEISSGIDPETARQIYQRAANKMQNGILFLISHNSSCNGYANHTIQL